MWIFDLAGLRWGLRLLHFWKAPRWCWCYWCKGQSPRAYDLLFAIFYCLFNLRCLPVLGIFVSSLPPPSPPTNSGNYLVNFDHLFSPSSNKLPASLSSGFMGLWLNPYTAPGAPGPEPNLLMVTHPSAMWKYRGYVRHVQGGHAQFGSFPVLRPHPCLTSPQLVSSNSSFFHSQPYFMSRELELLPKPLVSSSLTKSHFLSHCLTQNTLNLLYSQVAKLMGSVGLCLQFPSPIWISVPLSPQKCLSSF